MKTLNKIVLGFLAIVLLVVPLTAVGLTVLVFLFLLMLVEVAVGLLQAVLGIVVDLLDSAAGRLGKWIKAVGDGRSK